MRLGRLFTGQPHHLQHPRHPAEHLLPGNAHVLQTEGDIVLDRGPDDLVFGILEQQAHPGMDLPAMGQVGGREPTHHHLTLLRGEQAVGKPGQRALPRAVAAHERYHLSRRDRQVECGEGGRSIVRVSERDSPKAERRGHVGPGA